MAFCPNCGREHAAHARFCADCGTRLDISGSVSPGPSGTISQIDPLTAPVAAIDQSHSVPTTGSFYGLTRKNVWLMFFLTILTLGIYMPYWYLTRHQIFNALSSTAKFRQATILIWLLWFVVDSVLVVLSIALPQSGTIKLLTPIESIFNLAAGIFGLILVFRARKILLEHLAIIGRNDIPMSSILTFFFGFLYIQYKINQLAPEQTN